MGFEAVTEPVRPYTNGKMAGSCRSGLRRGEDGYPEGGKSLNRVLFWTVWDNTAIEARHHRRDALWLCEIC